MPIPSTIYGSEAVLGMQMMKKNETIISLSGNSSFMSIQTTDHSMMHLFDKFVKQGTWRLTEIGKNKGEILFKIYEAPKEFLVIKTGTDKNEINITEKLKNESENENTDDNFCPELDRFHTEEGISL